MSATASLFEGPPEKWLSSTPRTSSSVKSELWVNAIW